MGFVKASEALGSNGKVKKNYRKVVTKNGAVRYYTCFTSTCQAKKQPKKKPKKKAKKKTTIKPSIPQVEEPQVEEPIEESVLFETVEPEQAEILEGGETTVEKVKAGILSTGEQFEPENIAQEIKRRLGEEGFGLTPAKPRKQLPRPTPTIREQLLMDIKNREILKPLPFIQEIGKINRDFTSLNF